jgi:hypothetical protein
MGPIREARTPLMASVSTVNLRTLPNSVILENFRHSICAEPTCDSAQTRSAGGEGLVEVDELVVFLK